MPRFSTRKRMGILIGIDPGEHTGIAVWDTARQQFRDVLTLPLHRALEYVRRENLALLANSPNGRFLVVFEDARLRTWFPRERSNAEYRGRLMGAGAAKRDARIWEEFLTDLHIPYEAHKPQAGGTKWDAGYWARVTGWKGRTSQHARDAALLVFQRR